MPIGVVLPTVTVADAVPPTPPAGVVGPMEMVPGSDGAMLSMVRLVTTPSVSRPVTNRVAGNPPAANRVAPQVATGSTAAENVWLVLTAPKVLVPGVDQAKLS